MRIQSNTILKLQNKNTHISYKYERKKLIYLIFTLSNLSNPKISFWILNRQEKEKKQFISSCKPQKTLSYSILIYLKNYYKKWQLDNYWRTKVNKSNGYR